MACMQVRFTIPGKPQPLQRARLMRMRNGAVRHYTPDESTEYQEKVRMVAVLAGCPVFAKGCTVWMSIFLPDNRARDRDNIEKGIVDALQPKRATKTIPARRAVAWMNDHDIGTVHRRWEVDREQPRVELIILGEVLAELAR
jgi:Holliday junction resolvase RusA-like endonuclease